MTDIVQNTRITSADTWTEVAGATKGVTAGHKADIDFIVTNLDADANNVLIAITATSTAPSADTDAFTKVTLSALAAGASSHIFTGERLLLPSSHHLWVKSDQTDTRVMVSGYTEATS
jgi:hypothetical protein